MPASGDLVLAELGRSPGSGLIAGSDIFVVGLRKSIMKSAEQHRVPVISAYRQFVVEGSLMSYGPNTADIFRRSSSYVDRILKGESPGNLPVQSPTQFELAVNLKTAKALGPLGSRVVLTARRRGDRIEMLFAAVSLLALSGHALVHCECLLSGVKQTCGPHHAMSAFDPKRTLHKSFRTRSPRPMPAPRG